MAGIFISHSSADNADAEEVARRLHAEGYQALFLDFDPAEGIPAGRHWEREIYDRLRACSGVILLCSEHSMASDWCFAEITHARALGKHLFPVVISPCNVRPILLDTQIVDLAAGREAGFERLFRGMRQAGLDPADLFAWDASRPPYPGLTSFTAQDAAVFFGRDADQRACLDILAQMQRYGGDRLLLVIGTSGSGKSSLVRAGVIPRLSRLPTWRVLEPMRPGRNPVDQLARVLSRAFEEPGIPGRQRLNQRLRASPDGKALEAIVSELLDATVPATEQVLLVVDQLEELLTTSQDAPAAHFVRLLKAVLASQSAPFFCLATLRSDYLAGLQNSPLWQQTSFRELSLGPMTPQHFAEIIVRPAQVAGIELEAGLVETMVRDTGGPDALPLLAFTLNRLWREYGSDGRITLAEYRDRIGGLEGSIRQEAEAVLASIKPSPAQLGELRRTFRRLVMIDAHGQYTKRPLAWREVPASIQPLMEAFVRARLLVSGQETPKTTEEIPTEGTPLEGVDKGTLEVAHEALFRAWDKLRRWLDDDRAFLLWRQRIEPDAAAWAANPAEQGVLLRGGPLAEAERWLGERHDEIEIPLRQFILASRRVARRTRYLWRSLEALVAIGLVAVSWLAIEVWQQRQEALSRLVNSYWNIGIAARDADDHPIKAAHYFSRVADLTEKANEKQNALVSVGLLTGGVELTGMRELAAAPAAYRSPQGDDVLLVWTEQEAELIDLQNGDTLARARHEHAVSEAVIGADRHVASLTQAGGLYWWGPAVDGKRQLDSAVTGMTLDSAGTRLVSWGEAGVLRIWDLATGRETARLDTAQPLAGVRFLDAPGRVLTWGADGRFQILEPVEGSAVAAWRLECEPEGLGIDADHGRLLTWCDKELALSDSRQGVTSRSWRSPESVDKAILAPGGSTVVSWNEGSGEIRIWNAEDGTPRFDEPLVHEGGIVRAQLTPDGERLITSGGRGRIALWNLREGQLAARAVQGSEHGPVKVELSRDGQRVLAWSGEAGARLWDTATLTPLSLPLLHPGALRGALFFDEDSRVATWGEEATLRLWRRHPEREVTAPAPLSPAATKEWTAPSPEAVLDASIRQALTEALGERGLGDYDLIDRRPARVLVASGQEARVVTLASPAPSLSPPLTLPEDVRGGFLEPNRDRLVLWGASSVRLWDGASGRPLSALFRSDVLFPTGTRQKVGTLLTWDPDRAREWRWQAPDTGSVGARSWLEAVNAVRVDELDAVQALSRTQWCAVARAVGRQPLGCSAPLTPDR